MQLISTVLKSYGQIFFQQSWVLGAFILLGLAVAAPVACLFSLLGVGSSLLTAMALHAPKGAVQAGLYGFNGILAGIATHYFVKQLPAAVIITILASVIATIIFYIFVKNHLTALTFPFVLVGWAIVIITRHLK